MGPAQEGAQATMLIEDKAHCTIEYDPALKCVIQTWKGFAGSENFRASILKTIDAFAQHEASSIISNTQDSKVVSQPDADWVAEYANPILISHGLRKMAFIVPVNVFARRSVDRFREETKGQALAIRYFDDVDKAKAWLAE
jgi:hypothetical protein